MNNYLRKVSLLIVLIILTEVLSACRSTIPTDEIPETPPAALTLTPLPTPEPDSRSLTICLGDEPTTLYAYGELNAAARSVLSAIYDGPYDVSNYEYEPVILEKMPRLLDDDAQVNPITVSAGTKVVDTNGAVVTLESGTRIRPKGCRSDACAISYDGSSKIEMDQMVVNFLLLEDLLWSDGEPLTASDSVYSFTIASDKATPGSKYLIERTAAYEAADDITVQWWGLPGFIDPDYYTNFWIPLPEHAWKAGNLTAAKLLEADDSTRTPLGWGPFIVDTWTPGESIHLVKNLNYFRAEFDLPRVDELTFRFMPDPNAAISALLDGTCDMLDPSIDLDGQLALLSQIQVDGQALAFAASSNIMEWLAFGIVPASYDNGYNTSGGNPDRADIFHDVRTRKAIALCLDRQKVADTVLFGVTQVPDGYLPFEHPLHNGSLQTYPFDPVSGREILDQVGWVDIDKDPSTPRVSFNVSKVPQYTPLVLDYYTTSATQRRQIVEIFTESLADCGIGLNPIFLPASEFYKQGPAGPLFGRRFDLAEYAIGVNTYEPQCAWFTSSQIPNPSNQWSGTNVSGYSDTEFDKVCGEALQVLPTEPGYTSHQTAQSLFAADVPAIPLFPRLKIVAARADFCGFQLDVSTIQVLDEIEMFDYGTGCEQDE